MTTLEVKGSLTPGEYSLSLQKPIKEWNRPEIVRNKLKSVDTLNSAFLLV